MIQCSLYNDIEDDVFLNGKVSSVSSKGSQVYKDFWNTSTLVIPFDKSKLQLLVCWEDTDSVNALK